MLCLCVICPYIPIHLCVGECESISRCMCVCSIHAHCTAHTIHSILSLNRCKTTLIQPIMIARPDLILCLFRVFFHLLSWLFKVFGCLLGWLPDRFRHQIRQENYNHLSNCRRVFSSKKLLLLFCNRFKI